MNGHQARRRSRAIAHPRVWRIGRGAFPRGRMDGVSHPGPAGKANAGMSNDNARAKRAHRKTKGSPAMLISGGSGGA